jgi:hypothetical protein
VLYRTLAVLAIAGLVAVCLVLASRHQLPFVQHQPSPTPQSKKKHASVGTTASKPSRVGSTHSGGSTGGGGGPGSGGPTPGSGSPGGGTPGGNQQPPQPTSGVNDILNGVGNGANNVLNGVGNGLNKTLNPNP